MKPRPWARRLLGLGLVAAALYFLGRTVASNAADLRGFDWRLDPLLLAASLVVHVAVLVWGVWVWSLITRRFAGEAMPFPALLRVWSFSNAARYIPGTVWQFVAAAELARGEGLGRGRLLLSMAVHVGMVLVAAVGLAVATLPWDALGAGWIGTWGLAALPLLLVAVHPAVLNLALRTLARVTRREAARWTGSWLDGVLLLALETASWVLYGVAFWLFLRSVAPIPAGALLPLAGVNSLSFAAGWVVFFAPGGIGVRETAMTLLLGPFVPAAVAAVLSVLSRLWTVAAEVLLAGVALLVAARGRRGAERG